jgi:hypothetical protein
VVSVPDACLTNLDTVVIANSETFSPPHESHCTQRPSDSPNGHDIFSLWYLIISSDDRMSPTVLSFSMPKYLEIAHHDTVPILLNISRSMCKGLQTVNRPIIGLSESDNAPTPVKHSSRQCLSPPSNRHSKESASVTWQHFSVLSWLLWRFVRLYNISVPRIVAEYRFYLTNLLCKRLELLNLLVETYYWDRISNRSGCDCNSAHT